MSDRIKAEAELKAARIALARLPHGAGMARSWALNRVIVAERAVAAAK